VGELLAAAALVLYASNIMLTKVASARVDISVGFLLSVGVNVLFSLLLLCVQLGMRTAPLAWHWHGFFLFLLAGVFATYLGRWFFFESVVRFGPARASIFQISAPLFTVLIAWVFLGERLKPSILAGIGLTVLGLFVVVYVPGAMSARGSAAKKPPAAVASRLSPLKWIFNSSISLGMFASLAYAVGNVMRGAAVRDWDEPIAGGLLGALSGIALHLLFSSGTAKSLSNLKSADRTGVLMFMFTGTLNISAQILVIFSLRYIPVSIATLIASCVPVLVIPMSYFLLKNQEGIVVKTVIGAALTLAGIGIILLA
jgi:drug/metabolite transporter (DMT)-like permease